MISDSYDFSDSCDFSPIQWISHMMLVDSHVGLSASAILTFHKLMTSLNHRRIVTVIPHLIKARRALIYRPGPPEVPNFSTCYSKNRIYGWGQTPEGWVGLREVGGAE